MTLCSAEYPKSQPSTVIMDVPWAAVDSSRDLVEIPLQESRSTALFAAFCYDRCALALVGPPASVLVAPTLGIAKIDAAAPE